METPYVVGIVQARMGSSRLPAKVMKPLGSDKKEVLWHVMNRLTHSKGVHHWILATTTEPMDDVIEQFCARNNITCFRGNALDVLDRYYKAALAHPRRPDIVVRITSDNPLIDPQVIDACVSECLDGKFDFYGLWDGFPKVLGFPDGLDCEVMTMGALQDSWQLATRDFEREHVTFWIRCHPERHHLGQHEKIEGHGHHRWTLDTDKDYEFISAVYDHMYKPGELFFYRDVLTFLDSHPEIVAINSEIPNNFGIFKSFGEFHRGDKGLLDFSERFITNFEKSYVYRKEVHNYIPGGAHTYSKGDDQFPELAPSAIARGKGCNVWDIDGNKYVDFTMGLGSISLGHAYEPILKAVREQIEDGANFQRPHPIELEAAKTFLDLIPGHDRMKFAKNGSTATTAAVKLSRAHTGRQYIALPATHPFYSYDDWFISRKPNNSGCPDSVTALSLLFDPVKPETLQALFDEHPDAIAAVIMEPEEAGESDPEHVHECYRITHAAGAVFILDEMLSGFRAGFPGAQTVYKYKCDLATWGKAIANGFSFCCLTGRAEIMDLGGIKQTERERVFLVSTTHGGETHAIAAFLAVLKEYQTKDVIFHLHRMLRVARESFVQTIEACGLSDNITVLTLTWRIIFVFKVDGKVSMPLRTLAIQEMIGRGVLFQGLLLACLSHTDVDVDHLCRAWAHTCDVLKKALAEGIDKYLVGPPTLSVFRKFNDRDDVCNQIR